MGFNSFKTAMSGQAGRHLASSQVYLLVNLFNSPGLCPWRAHVVTQALASASAST